METPTASPAISESPTSLSIPLALPCGALDSAATEEIIAGPIAQEFEWEPGDTPFENQTRAQSNFGCQYVGEELGDTGFEPDFGIIIPGEELTEEEWAERTSGLTGCRELAAPAGLGGDAVKAQVCETAAEGWSQVVVSGLFGGTGFLCNSFTPDERVDDALEVAVVAECVRIVLELAS